MADIQSSVTVHSKQAYIKLRKDPKDGWEFIEIECLKDMTTKRTIRLYEDEDKYTTFRSLFPRTT